MGKIYSMLGNDITSDSVVVSKQPIFIEGLKKDLVQNAKSNINKIRKEDGSTINISSNGYLKEIIVDKFLGLCTHLNRNENRDLQKDYLLNSKMFGVRDGIEWTSIEIDTSMYFDGSSFSWQTGGAGVNTTNPTTVDDCITADEFRYRNNLDTYQDDSGTFEFEIISLGIGSDVDITITYKSSSGETVLNETIPAHTDFERYKIRLENVVFTSSDTFHIKVNPVTTADFKLKKFTLRKLKTYTIGDSVYTDYYDYNFDEVEELITDKEYSLKEIIWVLGFTQFNHIKDPSVAPWETKYPPLLESWLKFIRILIDTYKDRVEYWQLWNEPNIQFWQGTDEEYFQFVKDTIPEIKNISENIIVVSAGTATTDESAFIDELINTGTMDYFDYYSHHFYREDPLDVENISTLINKVSEQNTRTLVTEIGWSTHQGTGNLKTTIQEQAEYHIKNMCMLFGIGVLKCWIYDLKNDGEDILEKEDNFGILNYDTSEKKSAIAIKTALNVLEGYKYVGWQTLGDNENYLFVFEKDGVFNGVMWRLSTIEEFNADTLLEAEPTQTAVFYSDSKHIFVEVAGEATEIVSRHREVGAVDWIDETQDSNYFVLTANPLTEYEIELDIYDEFGALVDTITGTSTTTEEYVTSLYNVRCYLQTSETDYSNNNTILCLVESVHKFLEGYRRKEFEDITEYEDLELIATKIVALQLQTKSLGVSSKKLGEYSINYNTNASIQELLSEVKRFGCFL